MPTINRDFDISEQKESFVLEGTAVSNGVDYILKTVERACVITDCKVSTLGLSGAPTMTLKALRFVAGTGGSSFAIGGALTLGAFGTSGFQSYSLNATGSSQLYLQKGDVLLMTAGGGSSAGAAAIVAEVVVQNIQDIKTWY